MPARPVKPRKTCTVGYHGPWDVLGEDPLLLRCQKCGNFMGDESGLTLYGRERPMLSA